MLLLAVCAIGTHEATAQIDLSSAPPESEAYYYDFHPLSTLRLGGSFDPNHLDEGKISPIEKFDTIRPEGYTGAIQTQFDLHMVSSAEQLQRVVQFDAKTSVRYFRVKGNARFSSLNSYTFNKEDINLVITARAEYPRRAITGYTFTKEAEDLMNEPRKFRRAYGTRVVTMERLGASVYVILKMSNVSTAMRKRIAADFGMQGKFGPVKVKVSAAFRNEFMKSNRESRTDFTLISTGDPAGLKSLAELFDSVKKQGVDFDTLMNNIKKYFEKMEPADAKPIGYFTTSIENLGLPRQKLKDVLFSERLEHALSDVAEQYRVAQGEIGLINDLLALRHPGHVHLDAASVKNLQDGLKELTASSTLLVQRQREIIEVYDDVRRQRQLDRLDRKYEKVANGSASEKWDQLFHIPRTPIPATRFLETKVDMRLCTRTDGTNPELVLYGKDLAMVRLRMSWLHNDSVANRADSTWTDLWVDPKGNVVTKSTGMPLDAVFGAHDTLSFKFATDTMLRERMETRLTSIVESARNAKIASNQDVYDVDLLVTNALKEEVSIPLGVFYYNDRKQAGLSIPYHHCVAPDAGLDAKAKADTK